MADNLWADFTYLSAICGKNLHNKCSTVDQNERFTNRQQIVFFDSSLNPGSNGTGHPQRRQHFGSLRPLFVKLSESERPPREEKKRVCHTNIKPISHSFVRPSPTAVTRPIILASVSEHTFFFGVYIFGILQIELRFPLNLFFWTTCN